eukprot:scaffold1884_cov343-Ochromonas_danica.AAC.32
MLEGDEILESAQETGYRLCVSSTSTKKTNNRVFSAAWDKAVERRLWLCFTDGSLEVHDLNKDKVLGYSVLFRRFISAHEESESEEKVINSHWDKMVTIPSRPHEIIFLLGISKTLCYTSLPFYPKDDESEEKVPLLTTFARNQPGYVHGSPVMEIVGHATRITSLAVSSGGDLLASGDESGHVRLLLLQLLDTIQVITSRDKRKKSSLIKPTPRAAYHPFLPSYNIIKKIHHGPVFALSWILSQPALGAARSSCYLLATASIDRAVRLWQVSCSTAKGLDICPWKVLDTLSTHILSLDCFMTEDRERLYLTAGTAVGTVHIWKMDGKLVQKLISPTSEEENGPSEGVDGREFCHLVALLQPSDQPIIHLSLTEDLTHMGLMLDGPPRSPRRRFTTPEVPQVLLALSDTKGLVRIYGSTWQSPVMTNNLSVDYEEGGLSSKLPSQEGLSLSIDVPPPPPPPTAPPPSLPNDDIPDDIFAIEPPELERLKTKFAPQLIKVAVKKVLQAENPSLTEGFVPIREEMHDVPIVACAFNNHPTATSRGVGHELLIAGHNNKVEIYSLDQLIHHPFSGGDDSDHDRTASEQDEASSVRETRLSSGIAGIDLKAMGLHQPSDLSFAGAPRHRASSPSSAGHGNTKLSTPSPAAKKSNASQEVISPGSSIEIWPRVEQPVSSQVSVQRPFSNQPSLPPKSSTDTAAAAVVGGSSSSSAPQTSVASNRLPSEVNNNNKARRKAAAVGSSIDENEEVPRPLPRVVREQALLSSSPASKKTASGSVEQPKRFQPQEPASPIPIQQTPSVQKVEYEPSPYEPKNSFTHPALHSAKVLEARLSDMQNELELREDDLVSVSTLQTTESDRRHAAVKSTVQTQERRYTTLPAAQYLDERDLQDIVKELKADAKVTPTTTATRPVRRDRMLRTSDDLRSEIGLSDEEWSLLQVPDPRINLNLFFNNQASGSSR